MRWCAGTDAGTASVGRGLRTPAALRVDGKELADLRPRDAPSRRAFSSVAAAAAAFLALEDDTRGFTISKIVEAVVDFSRGSFSTSASVVYDALEVFLEPVIPELAGEPRILVLTRRIEWIAKDGQISRGTFELAITVPTRTDGSESEIEQSAVSLRAPAGGARSRGDDVELAAVASKLAAALGRTLQKGSPSVVWAADV